MRAGCEPLVAGERPAVVPLSFAQSRLWFFDQLQGPSPVYNMSVALRLRGRLDAEALGAALADVVARHESLRTVFAAPEGVPQQVVLPAERADVGWQVVDADRLVGAPAGRGRRRGGASHVSTWPADIPLRATAFPRRPTTSTSWWPWCTTSPPTAGRSPRWCSDSGWPMPAGVRGRPRVGRLPVQYVDYTLWQRAQLGELDDGDSPIAAQLAYWEEALAGMPERLRAADRSALPGGGRSPRRPGGRATGRPNCSSRCAGWPANTTRPASWWCRRPSPHCCPRSSASSDVAVGFPIAGRRDPALDELVGFFVNTLVLRVDVAGDPTFADLLAQVRRRSLAAYEHQDVPFEVLVERLNPTRSPDSSPAGAGDVGLAELRLAGRATPPGWPSAICR